MKVFRAAQAVLICGVLSLSLGAAGPAGLLLRIRKKYLEEELAKRLTSLGEDLTHLVEARKKRPHSPAGQTPRRHHFGHPPPPAPRITVEVPHLPGAEITMRSSKSLDIHFKVLFGIYLEQPFDALSKEVQIQLRKNFTVLLSGSRNGFSIQGCSSCPDSLDVKTLYR
ncbi:hypothetical protein lerEdw1_005002 [Lerista edwardsae]|nr:hypothetical protein lerEdw1_005002 [Lerista edwardsae]